MRHQRTAHVFCAVPLYSATAVFIRTLVSIGATLRILKYPPLPSATLPHHSLIRSVLACSTGARLGFPARSHYASLKKHTNAPSSPACKTSNTSKRSRSRSTASSCPRSSLVSCPSSARVPGYSCSIFAVRQNRRATGCVAERLPRVCHSDEAETRGNGMQAACADDDAYAVVGHAYG